jgi:hypothetical protein
MNSRAADLKVRLDFLSSGEAPNEQIKWSNIIHVPVMNRTAAMHGYKDGVHGPHLCHD